MSNLPPRRSSKTETVVEPATTKKGKPSVGKPVKPVTIQEELDDNIPNFGIKE
jgi:hypothetical protein